MSSASRKHMVLQIILSLVRFLSNGSHYTVSLSHGVDKFCRTINFIEIPHLSQSVFRMSQESHEALKIICLTPMGAVMTRFESLFIDKKFEIILSLVCFLSSDSLYTVSSSNGVDKFSKIFTLVEISHFLQFY